ncbi:MAG: HlyC/CorC family transporter [Caulobacterales bacterium]|jgi:Mg2+/Co2+ transporter CorB
MPLETILTAVGIAALCAAVLAVISGFFSAAETGITAASRARLHQLEKDGDAGAKRVNKLLERRERTIGALLLGNNLLNTMAAAVTTSLLTAPLGDIGVAVATGVTTIIVLIFAEVLPKTYAIAYPEKTALAVAPLAKFFITILSPIVIAVQWIVTRTLKLFGVTPEAAPDAYAAQEEIRGAVEMHADDGAVETDVRDRLRGALELGDLTVADVMVHRKAIRMLDVDLPAREILAQAMASSHTRLPLFKDEPENIVGVLHARDLLRAVSEKGRDGIEPMAVARPAWFVPETTAAEDQLAEFLRRREHFALVVDEYGALKGLVTLEDILEEIVGDIKDEHDIAVTGVRQQPDGSVNVDGWVPIRDLNRAMNWSLKDDHAVTVAGLVIHEAEAIPDPGQVFVFHGYRFAILRRTRNQITALRVEKEPENVAADGG